MLPILTEKKMTKIFNSIKKIIAIALIVGMNWNGLAAVGQTYASFSDAHSVGDNSMSAGSLDFSAESDQDFAPEIFFAQDGQAKRTVVLEKIGSQDVKYAVAAVDFSGDNDLCDNLQMKAGEGGFMPLAGFFATSTLDSSVMDIDFSAGLINLDFADQGKTCAFNLEITGWQTNFDAPDGGFVVKKTIPSEIKTGDRVIINELMWTGSTGNPNDEWIELRNPGASEVNIGGWQMTKLTDAGESLMLQIPEGATIGAGGFYLISRLSKNNSALSVDSNLVSGDVDLRDKNLQVKLYNGQWDGAGAVVDIAGDGYGDPLGGFKGKLFGLFNFSMERNDTPGNGALKSSWHTCWDDSDEMRSYWDTLPIPWVGSLNRGTPTVRNLSDYDDAAERARYAALEEEWAEQQIVDLVEAGGEVPETITLRLSTGAVLDIPTEGLDLDEISAVGAEMENTDAAAGAVEEEKDDDATAATVVETETGGDSGQTAETPADNETTEKIEETVDENPADSTGKETETDADTSEPTEENSDQDNPAAITSDNVEVETDNVEVETEAPAAE